MQTTRSLGLLILVALAGVAAWFLWRPADVAPPVDAAPVANAVRTDDAEVANAKVDGSGAEARVPVEREAAAVPAAASLDAAAAVVLVGRVVDEQNRAVVGANVQWIDPRSWPSRTPGSRRADADADAAAAAPKPQRRDTVTDANGVFRIAAGEAGDSPFLRVRARAHRVLDHAVRTVAAGETDLGTLTLRSGAVVSGRVVDGDGAPIAGARVSRESARPRPDAGGATPAADFGDFGDFDFDLGEFGDLDAADAPVAAADFPGASFVSDLFTGRVSTDAEGRFELAHCEPGDFSLRARHPDRPSARREGLSVAGGATLTDVVVTMAPGASVRGVVVGAPEGDVKFRVLAAVVRTDNAPPVETPFGEMGPEMGEMMADFGGIAERSARVADDHTFALRGLHPGRAYRVWLAQGDQQFGPKPVCSLKLEVRPPVERLEIRFDPGTTVTFQVVDEKGTPIERLWVRDQLRGGGGFEEMMPMMGRQGSSAAYPEGKVLLSNLRPKKKQTLSLRIEATRFATFERKDIALPPQGALDLGVIRLEAAPAVTVAVRAKDTGSPVANAQVRVTAVERPAARENPFARMGPLEPGPRSGRTDQDGTCVLNSVPDGPFVVEITTQDFAPHRSEPIVAGKAGSSTHDVVLLRGGTVEAFVAAAAEAVDAAAPAASTEIRVQHASPSGARDSKSTDREGKVVFDHLEPGAHHFRISDRAGGFDLESMAAEFGGEAKPVTGPGWQTVDVADGSTAQLRLTRDPTATVRGVVRENGGPVADARVTFVEGPTTAADAQAPDNIAAMMADLGGPSASGRTARTGADGAFELKNLKAGAHRLRVTSKGRAMPAVIEVNLNAGENAIDVTLELAIVRGKVTDPTGQPVAGASVTIVVVPPSKVGGDPMAEALDQVMPGVDVSAFASNNRAVKTQADGTFELRGVQSGKPVQVRATSKPFAAAVSPPFQLPPNGTHDGVEIRLFAAGKVKVTTTEAVPFQSAQARLLGADGEPVKGVPPVVQMLGNGSGTLTGLRAGRWRVDLLRPGATDAPATRQVDVIAGETATVSF